MRGGGRKAHVTGYPPLPLVACPGGVANRRVLSYRGHLGVELSTSTLNQCLHEAGRAVEPIEEQLVEELQQAALAYPDERPWKEWGQLLRPWPGKKDTP